MASIKNGPLAVTAGLVFSRVSAFSVVCVVSVGDLENFLLDFLWRLFRLAYTTYTSYILTLFLAKEGVYVEIF